MKAKEYARIYIEKKAEVGVDQALAHILTEMSHEFGELGKTRQVKTDAGMVGLMREFNDKWRSFAGAVGVKCDGVRTDGFLRFWNKQVPEGKALLERNGILELEGGVNDCERLY